MYTQKQEQKLKTIDLNDFLDGFHNYRTIANDHQTISSHPFTVKLRNHMKERAETCFSIQGLQPQTRSSARTNMQNRYSREPPLKEEDQKDLENINLDQFMHVVCNKNDPLKANQHTHDFIRSLNGTWFQGTNQQFKCNKIFNTLGIKKNRSFNKPRSQRFHPEHLRERVDLNKQFRPNGLFPSRKSNLPIRIKVVKSPSFNNHHQKSPTKINEGCLKYQIVNSIKHQINAKPNTKASSRGAKNNVQVIAGNFNNERIANKMKQDGVIKGKKMVIYD